MYAHPMRGKNGLVAHHRPASKGGGICKFSQPPSHRLAHAEVKGCFSQQNIGLLLLFFFFAIDKNCTYIMDVWEDNTHGPSAQD